MAITGTLGTITILSLPFGGSVVTVPANEAVGVGGAEPVYTITICDAFGAPLLRPRDWEMVQYSLVESAFGHFRLELPGYYPAEYFKPDGLVAIERALGNAAPALLAERTVYRLRGRRRRQMGNSPFFTWELRGPDVAEVLARRHVDAPAGSSYARKSAAGDDLLKAIVRENFGSLASDTTRALASLSVQANLSAAPTLSKSFPWRKVLPVLQELVAASLEAGTYLAFDVVPTWAPGAGPFAAEFRTYTGQRGLDHRFPGGNPPVLIGPDFGNLDAVEVDDNWEDEATRVIVAGQGLASARAVRRANDTTRQGVSPWGLIEHFEDSRNTTASAALLDEAEALLRMMRPRRLVTGRIRATAGLLLGAHYNFGDFVTYQGAGDSFDAHLSALVVNKRRDAAEDVDLVLRTEE